jgi:hypothetical protein
MLVPDAMPVTMPAASIVAIAGVPLVHVPPVVVLLSVVVRLWQTASVPVIAAGSGLTVTGVVVMQPVASVYVIFTTPADAPVITPPVLAVAIEPSALAHVPPVVAELRFVVSPTQIVGVPVIAAGSGLTVTTAVVRQPVGRR